MSIKNIQTEALPVAMYDTTDKKLVALFFSVAQANRYAMGEPGMRVQNLVRKKIKDDVNVWRRAVAFRYATTEQKALLGAEAQLILDERYQRPEFLNEYTIEQYKAKRTAQEALRHYIEG